MKTLGDLVDAHPNITVQKDHTAIDLITRNMLEGVREDKDVCLGCYVYDIGNNLVKTVSAKGVFIAITSISLRLFS